MKVRLLVALAGSSGALSGQAGDVREAPDDLCRKFIDGGLVEAVVESKAKPAAAVEADEERKSK